MTPRFPGTSVAVPPRLLVSVRDFTEVDAVVRGGGDIVDVKDPSTGPLGAPTVDSLRDIANQLRQRLPLSVALGEVVDLADLPMAELLEATPARYFKVGLSRTAGRPRLWQRFAEFCSQILIPAEPVAVTYADWGEASCTPPDEALRRAHEAGCRILLVDTFCKHRGDLWTHLSPSELGDLVEAAHESGCTLAVAGSLRTTTVAAAIRAGADVIGVRGGACRTDRLSAIDASRVAELASHLREFRASVG